MVRYENVKQIKFSFENGLEVFADISHTSQSGKYDVYFYINLKGLYIKYFVFNELLDGDDRTIKKVVATLVTDTYNDGKFDDYVDTYKKFILEACNLMEDEENGR